MWYSDPRSQNKPMDRPAPYQVQAAAAALRFIYPDLVFTDDQVTLDSAKFAFEMVRQVDLGARAAYGLFKLYTGTITITKWSDIPKSVYDAAKAAAERPSENMKSPVAVAFLALPYRRLIEKHLQDPAFPCRIPQKRFSFGTYPIGRLPPRTPVGEWQTWRLFRTLSCSCTAFGAT